MDAQHDQAGGRGDQRADHDHADQADAPYWPASAFSGFNISSGTLWAAARAGRVRSRWNRTHTRRQYSVADARLEWPHLIGSDNGN